MKPTPDLTPTPSRVVVAMSGGVDSSVAAALLVERGYEVIGMMMRLWSEPGQGSAAPANRCCTPDQMADARRVADHLGIPFYVIDVQSHFHDTIVQHFIDEHLAGNTPNPCILCNRQIRFTHLFQRAMALDADYLATGHYARIRPGPEGFRLIKGVDEHKDQSYVLHVLRQEQLGRVLFPCGDYTKDEIRELAAAFGLPVARKQESQDLCFLGDGDYRRFLREHAPAVDRPGPILDLSGRELGNHDGLAFYTIGQRKGLNLSTPEPVFVVRKDGRRNALIVGPRDALGQSRLSAHTVNWVSGEPPAGPIRAVVKIRYKAPALPAWVTPLAAGLAQVDFDEPVQAITSGQGSVFYQGEVCLGGGIIAPVSATDNESQPALTISLEVAP
jgi:tRNA-specific 2-thiouridylase